MTYEEFEQEYKQHHTCGYPMIPYNLSYASDCPMCEPNSSQWKEVCKEEYNKYQESVKKYKDHPMYSLYLNYAQRSLLGGGKGTFVVQQLEEQDKNFYNVVMVEARYLQKKNLSLPVKERIPKLVELVKNNLSELSNVTVNLPKEEWKEN
jgi:hypothetical protein